ncbi:MAG: DUF72 domain-containing protein [Desulfobacterota bacterium]|nr:DUF72 domain-containing protein [Thermodesulfobacteriota bacterium]
MSCEKKSKARILIGTSGFSFPDWKGNVYPPNIKNKDMLYFYAYKLNFETVEINSTYYAIPSAKTIKAMEEKTPDLFEFTVKAPKTITHDPFDPRLEVKPKADEIEKNSNSFSEALKPLVCAKKLGAILLQFPVFFYNTSKNKDYILFVSEKLSFSPIVCEFRHISWLKKETFDFLKRSGIGFCIVDEPQLPKLLPPVFEVTSSLAYVRFHGRNKNWFNAPLSERYDYLYSDEELRSFIPEIKKISTLAEKTYIFFNNCHMGKALKNALRFKEMLIEEGGI